MKDHNAFYKQVGEKIRSRRGKKLSQEALASAVGLTRTSISNIEKGRQRLLLHTLVDVADALQVEAASLLPDRHVSLAPVGAETLAQLSTTERVFIESAIGLKQKETHGNQEKEDSGIDPDASNGGEGHRSARPGLGDRPKKGGANRR